MSLSFWKKRWSLEDWGFKMSLRLKWFFFKRFFIVRYRRAERFFYWGWKLKDNCDNDYVELYEIIYLKLDRIDKKVSDSYSCWGDIGYGSQLRKLKTAKELAKRLGDDYCCLISHRDKMAYKKQLFEILQKDSFNWWT